MLKCKVQKLMHGSAHAQRCVDCLEQAQQTALTDQLLTQRASELNRQSYTLPPFFMAKLAARLRAEAEPYGLTWEHAVPALRGWLLAFSAAALLLIAAAFTLSANSAQTEEHVFTASASESNELGPNDAFWMGD